MKSHHTDHVVDWSEGFVVTSNQILTETILGSSKDVSNRFVSVLSTHLSTFTHKHTHTHTHTHRNYVSKTFSYYVVDVTIVCTIEFVRRTSPSWFTIVSHSTKIIGEVRTQLCGFKMTIMMRQNGKCRAKCLVELLYKRLSS